VTSSALTHFLDLDDFSHDELLRLIDLGIQVKSERKNGNLRQDLFGKSVAMIFQKPSNRTRLSFEVGIYEMGGHPILVRPDEIQMGSRESIEDVARVVSRYASAVVLRTNKHDDLKKFSEWSSVPIINALSDYSHPCQALADVMTIRERFPEVSGLTLTYLGDPNNVCRSLIQACRAADIGVRVACPRSYWDDFSIFKKNQIFWSEDPLEAVQNVHVIYTDVWTSMGQESETLKRTNDFRPYSVSESLFEGARYDAIFLHCLPAHRGEEVSDEVMDSKRSVVFDQAENRLHIQKAILLSVCE